MRYNERLDESYIPIVERLLKQNLTYTVIGTRIGRSYDSVKYFIRRYGLKNAVARDDVQTS